MTRRSFGGALRGAIVGAATLAACAPPAPAVHAPTPPVATPPAPPSAPPPGPPLLRPADVDALLRAEWARAGVAPASPAADATWLRRAWLDVLGTIPPPDVVVSFQADPSPDRRARAVDAMLASPAWAEHWARYWEDAWLGRGPAAPDVDRAAFRAWLRDAFARDTPWDALVTELLTATGVNTPGAGAAAGDAGAVAVRGAVNWTLQYAQTPQDQAGIASRTLLGVQIQCAQCHDHKTEKWTRHDFEAFAAAFARTRPVPIDAAPPPGTVRRVALQDLDRSAPRFAKVGDLAGIVAARPAALDGTDLGEGPVRAALARWVTSPRNPLFARAFVNRMWGHFLGRGFVDPVDDLRPSSPPAAPGVLDALAQDFAASGWSVKHLVRLVVSSEAYGLSAAALTEATAKADPEAKLWERFRLTPLGPDELLDALVAATGLDGIVRASGNLDLVQVRQRVRQRYGFLFDVDERSDEVDYEGTIAQALALLDGSVVGTGVRRLPGGALAEVLAAPGDDRSRVEALYVRALSRRPTPAEVTRWTRFLADASAAIPSPPPPRQARRPGQPDPLAGLENRPSAPGEDARARAFEDVLWTLVNSSEFVFNH